MKVGDLVTGRIHSEQNRVGIVLRQCSNIVWITVRWSCGMVETIDEHHVKAIACK